MHRLRLSCHSHGFWVDVRVTGINARWIASADTPDGPTLGLAFTPPRALLLALQPFEGLVDELLQTAPDEFFEHGAMG